MPIACLQSEPSHRPIVATAFEKLNQQDCMAKGTYLCMGILSADVVVIEGTSAYFLWVPFLQVLQYVIYCGAHAHFSKFKSKVFDLSIYVLH